MFNQNIPIDKMYSDSERKAASEHARSIFEIMMNNRAKTELDNLKRYNDVLESNGSIVNEIFDSLREGKLTVTYLRIYRVDENMLGLALLRLYSSIDVTNTYDTEFVGYFKLEEAVDLIVDFFKTKKISRLLLEKEIAKVVHRAVIFKGIEMMEEEEQKVSRKRSYYRYGEGKDGNNA